MEKMSSRSSEELISDGSMSFTVVYLTPDRGVRTVLQATAQAEPSDDG